MTKTSKSEILFAFLSLAVIALCAAIFFFHNDQQHQIIKTRKPQTAVTPKVDTALKDWTERLTALEQEPQAEPIQQLKTDYQDLDDSPEKAALAERLDALEEELSRLQTAEEAVDLAEQFGYQSYIQEAQALVANLTSPTTKARLQERLDKLATPAENTVPVQSSSEASSSQTDEE